MARRSGAARPLADAGAPPPPGMISVIEEGDEAGAEQSESDDYLCTSFRLSTAAAELVTPPSGAAVPSGSPPARLTPALPAASPRSQIDRAPEDECVAQKLHRLRRQANDRLQEGDCSGAATTAKEATALCDSQFGCEPPRAAGLVLLPCPSPRAAIPRSFYPRAERVRCCCCCARCCALPQGGPRRGGVQPAGDRPSLPGPRQVRRDMDCIPKIWP